MASETEAVAGHTAPTNTDGHIIRVIRQAIRALLLNLSQIGCIFVRLQIVFDFILAIFELTNILILIKLLKITSLNRLCRLKDLMEAQEILLFSTN